MCMLQPLTGLEHSIAGRSWSTIVCANKAVVQAPSMGFELRVIIARVRWDWRRNKYDKGGHRRHHAGALPKVASHMTFLIETSQANSAEVDEITYDKVQSGV